MKNILNRILLSDTVVNDFYFEYENNFEFKKSLLDVLPEIEEAKKLNQDNPWHIYNCLEHILRSVEEINKLSKNYNEDTRRLLSYTMFLHDIGKPMTKIRRFSKAFNREVDSFFGHNMVSKDIAERVLAIFDFNKDEIIVILNLIKEHDMFSSLRLQEDNDGNYKTLTTKYIIKKVNEFNEFTNGKDFLNLLILVGISDNKAQNPLLTQKPIKLLYVMKDMLDKI